MSNVNEEILQEHISTLAWFNANTDDENITGLVDAANYFLKRMQAAEQAAANLTEAAKRPPIEESLMFQKGYEAAVEDYKQYIPGGQGTVDRLKRRW